MQAATVTAGVESRIVHATVHDKPVNATHWSTRTLAADPGVEATRIHHVGHSNGLKPHLSRGFKLSRNPCFEDSCFVLAGAIGHLRPDVALGLGLAPRLLEHLQPGLVAEDQRRVQ